MVTVASVTRLAMSAAWLRRPPAVNCAARACAASVTWTWSRLLFSAGFGSASCVYAGVFL